MRISDWSSDVCSSDLLLVTLGKVALFLALVLIVGTRAAPWILERVARTGSRELFTLSVLAPALGIAFGSAALFGVSFPIGHFFGRQCCVWGTDLYLRRECCVVCVF